MIHKLTWLIILQIGIFNLALADTVGPIRTITSGHNDAIYSIAISPYGRYALSGSWDQTMKLWEVSSGAEIRTFNGHRNKIFSVAISPDGRYLLSGSTDKTMKLWEMSTGVEIRTFNGHSSQIESVSFSLDGRYALSGSTDNTMKLWDVSNGTEIHTFNGHSSQIKSVALSPDGRYALSGSDDDTMKLWDVSSGAEIRTFKGHISGVKSVAFSPYGRYVLSGSGDKTMKLWDVSSGAEIRTFKGHNSSINSVAFSPDGRYVLSGSYDSTMKLWEVSTGAEIRTFQGHIFTIYSVAFSPDGYYVFSGSWDRTLKVWYSGISLNPAPQATFSINPNTGFAPLTVQLDASTSTDDGNIVQYQWTSSDGQNAGGVKTSLTFSQVGTYNITLTVTDNEGATASSTQSITVIKPNQPPQAIFSINPNTGFAPLTVQLDATASSDDGNIVQYQWASSDGQTADGVQTSLTFSQVGTYNITLTVTDNEGATASNTQNITVNEKPLPPPVEGVGQAIIIAAGGAQPENTLFIHSNEFTQRFYRLLKQRGFEDENIYYMNPHAPDIDLDGYLEEDKHDYKLFDPTSELTTAFQQAASKLQAGQQFIFFLHGHARQDNFRIKADYELSASYLGELLAMLPAGVQQILILDSCYSGSFFDELAGVEGRILISSADSSNLAWNTKHASFTDKFLRSLGRSFNLTEAFQQAENLIISDKQLFGEQRPWLDDDGDGQYTSVDGRRAAQIYLGKEAVHAAPPPTIQVHPLIVLEQNTTEANLWVRTTPGSDGIRKVRAILINPEFSSGEYQGIETNFGREQLELIYNPVAQRYGIIYQGFKTPGMWRILYQAQSKEGIWSDIVQGEVQSQGIPKIASIKMQLNQSRYKITEPVRLDLVVNGQTEADLYVAIIFPNQSFITFGYPSNPSWPNEAKIYQAKVKIAGQHNYPVNINLPSNAELGQYSTCGVLVKTETAPLEMGNWIDFHCAGFEVSD